LLIICISCDIQVDESGRMCGKTFKERSGVSFYEHDPKIAINKAKLYRHIQRTHPGQVVLPTRAQVRNDERVAGENAIRLWVRSGGWRNARYLNEPGYVLAYISSI
jgi:hypothetical protein